MIEPSIRLVLSKNHPVVPEKPFRISFSFNTDLGKFSFFSGDTLDEIKELLPVAIQDAGAIYRMMKVLVEGETA